MCPFQLNQSDQRAHICPQMLKTLQNMWGIRQPGRPPMDIHVQFSTSASTEASVSASWITATHRAAQVEFFFSPARMRRVVREKSCRERARSCKKKKSFNSPLSELTCSFFSTLLEDSSSWIQTKEWKVKGWKKAKNYFINFIVWISVLSY